MREPQLANPSTLKPIDPKSAHLRSFVSHVQEEGKRLYRDLPWRYIDDPYAVLVSEVMLQQTQVSRVLPKWSQFLGLFPSLDALAAADTAIVLETWQGLGYNRRALSLKKAAEICAVKYHGNLPESYEELITLPGIGPATAAGVTAFAFDKPAMYLETNVRTVFLYELFPDREQVSDKELIPYIEATTPSTGVRDWYYALLDYGSHLKATVGNHSRRSTTYAKQSKFEGSRRQKRAEIVRIVLGQPGIDKSSIAKQLNASEANSNRPPVDEREFTSILNDLVNEGFFHKTASGYEA